MTELDSVTLAYALAGAAKKRAGRYLVSADGEAPDGVLPGSSSFVYADSGGSLAACAAFEARFGHLESETARPFVTVEHGIAAVMRHPELHSASRTKLKVYP